jgi:hypothetical protein
MALIGNATYEPWGPAENVTGVDPLPGLGELNTPFEAQNPTGVYSISALRFPTPPIAWGFPTLVLGAFTFPQSRLSSPSFMVGAVNPESSRLEPTIGQIWPR